MIIRLEIERGQFLVILAILAQETLGVKCQGGNFATYKISQSLSWKDNMLCM